MIQIRPEIQQDLEKIARESDRTLHQLVNDVLAGYVADINDLETSLKDTSDRALGTPQAEPVYVRRREADRRR